MSTEQRSPRARRALPWPDVQRAGPPDRGFTLVEILIAIVLVGILAAVAVVGVGQLSDKAAAATCAQSADASRVAAASYYANHQRYPATFAELTSAPSGGGGAALVLPAGVTAAGTSLVGASWALSMAPGPPPTFSCGPPSGAGAAVTTTTTIVPVVTSTVATTTTATTSTTTTAALGNGVTVTARTGGDLRYYGEHILTVANPDPLTAMTATIGIAQASGMSAFQQYTTFWSGAVAGSSSASGGVVSYTFSLNPGQTIVAGSWTLVGQWSGTGEVHPTAGDTWSVVSTSQGRTATLTGTF